MGVMIYAPEHRSPKNWHVHIAHWEKNDAGDYICPRCGCTLKSVDAMSLGLSDFFRNLRRGCVALPAPSVAPPVDVSSLPRVADSCLDLERLPVVV